MTQLTLFDGQTRKEIGQDQVLRNASDQWKEIALDCIIDLAGKGEFTSDDLRRSMDVLIPDNQNSWGAIFSSASKLKIIKKTGRYIQSKIPTCQGRVIAIWEKY